MAKLGRANDPNVTQALDERAWVLAEVQWSNRESNTMAKVLDMRGNVLVDSSLDYCISWLEGQAKESASFLRRG